MTDRTRRLRGCHRALALLATMITALVCAVGCGFPNRRGAADAIGQEIRASPGVADVEVSYDTSFDGGAHFRLTATLVPTATDEQGAVVARTFVERMIAADFSSFEVEFGLVYRRPGLSPAPDDAMLTNNSGLGVTYYYPTANADPSAEAVADGVRWWLDSARSLEINGINVSLPLDGPYADVRSPIGIGVPVSANDAALDALIRRHPQLKAAAWNVSLPSPERFVHPDTYSSVGRFPDHRSRQAWQQLVDLLRPTGQPQPIGSADASTQLPPRTPDSASTDVTVNLALDWDTAGEFEHIARSATALLDALPVPLLFKLHAHVLDSRAAISERRPVDRDLAVTVGGCTPPDPKYQHPSEPLETELRQQHERC